MDGSQMTKTSGYFPDDSHFESKPRDIDELQAYNAMIQFIKMHLGLHPSRMGGVARLRGRSDRGHESGVLLATRFFRDRSPTLPGQLRHSPPIVGIRSCRLDAPSNATRILL